jgi:hypothetical protein
VSSVLSLEPLALLALLSPSFPPCPVASFSNSLRSSPRPMMIIFGGWCWFGLSAGMLDHGLER